MSLLTDFSSANPIISEFVASNESSLEDASGQTPDWIEILNPTDTPIDLEGFALSDSVENLQLFLLPKRLLDPGERLIVFASGENLPATEGEIHTNFKLSANGESLFLTSPSGTLISQFIDYPALRGDEAYGLGFPDGGRPVVFASTGAEVKWLVPTEDIGETWREANFDDTSWATAHTGLGFGYPELTGEGGDVRAEMRLKSASIYTRITFDIEDPDKVLSMLLRMKFEDGFVAFLNGHEIAAGNAPSPLTWDAQATQSHPDSLAVQFEDTVINFNSKLIAGKNVLSIHGLNNSPFGSDFLLLPELHGELADDDITERPGFLIEPTPGLPNARVSSVGPVFVSVTENPPQPDTADLPIRVTAEGAAEVKMFYRTMYEDEIEIAMTSTNNQEFEAIIPAANLNPGEMVRWRFVATDAKGFTSKNPRFPDPENSPEYFGTVVEDPDIDTELPVFHRFLERASGTETRRGTRASVYYMGEFYDNVFSRIRGGTAVSWPKKSYKIEFNDSHHFLFREGVPRVDEFNLNATYTDKSYMRALLSAEVGLDAGLPSPETFHMRVHQNGEFFSVALFVEQPDADFLRRHDLDTNGALYKGGPGSNYDSRGPFEKKTRSYENKDDLQALLTGLKLRDQELENFVFDHIDLPTQINFLAIACITQNIDATDKNHYLYRDTEGSGEWHMLPWDLDLTFGPNALNTDTIVYNADRNFSAASHPFIGATPHLLHNGKYNRLIEAIVDVDRSREMLLRRIRTLTDTYLATSYFPDRIDELVTSLNPDVEEDHAKWLTRAHFGGRRYTLREANDRIVNEYLTPRVPYLTVDQALPNDGAVGIPPTQSTEPMIEIAHIEISPASGNQDEEFIELRNLSTTSVDLSGWTIRGSVKLNINPGTVIPAGDSLFLTPDIATFRARAESPKGDEAAFVQGNYRRHFPTQEGIVRLSTKTGFVVDSFDYQGASTDLQSFLRVTEINYNPPGENDAAAEFIELQNTGTIPLDLTGVQFADGISFTFPQTTLAPGAFTTIVRDSEEFRDIFGDLKIAGNYSGSLGNDGERLLLLDPEGEEILNFEYNDIWYPATDGNGSSLIIRNPDSPSYTWDDAESWTALPVPSPASANTIPEPIDYEAWKLANFPGNPVGSQPTDDPDADGLTNLLEYAFATDPKKQSIEPVSLSNEKLRYNRVSGSTDLSFILQSSSDLQVWKNTTATEIVTQNGNIETVILSPSQALESSTYYRLRVTKK